MDVNIELNNLDKAPVRKALFERAVKDTLGLVARDHLKNKEISISIAIVGEAEIKKLNRTYRKKNRTTDVLSFAEYRDQKAIKEAKGKQLFLGELVLCYNDIEKYAKKRKIPLKQELAEVISHGVLHLLGFRHGRKMFDAQNLVAKK